MKFTGEHLKNHRTEDVQAVSYARPRSDQPCSTPSEIDSYRAIRILALCLFINTFYINSLPTTALAETTQIKLDLPDPVPLDTLLDYASERLDLNIIYDRQRVSGEVTLQSPTEIPTALLRPLIDSVLRSRNLALIDGEGGGWLRVVSLNELSGGARPEGAVKEGQTVPAGNATHPAVVSRVFLLDRLAGQQAVQLVQPFLTPGGGSVQVADGGNGAGLLLVTDFARTVDRVAALLEALSTAGGPRTQRFHLMKHGNAADLSVLLIQALAAGQPQGRGEVALPVDVVVDEAANRLLLMGPTRQVEAALLLAEALDTPSGLMPRVYAMDHISADRFEEQMRGMLEASQSPPAYGSKAEGRRLVVTASEATHTHIASLKRLVDTPRTGVDSPLQFYQLKNANAADVLATLRSLSPEASRPTAAGPAQSGPAPLAAGELYDPGPLGGRPLGEPARTAEPQGALGRGGNGGLSGGSGANTGAAAPIQGVQTDDATITADVNTNSIIVVAAAEAQAFYAELIAKLDQRRPQVMIEATLVTLDTSDNFTFGVDVLAGDNTGDNQSFAFSSFGLSTIGDNNRLDLVPTLGFNGAVLEADIADVVLQALKGEGRSRAVSAPRVLVNDNETGRISSQIEQPVASLNQGQNSDQLAFEQFVEAGTEIEVVPHIAEGDHLRLEFTLTLGSFADGGGSATLPAPRQTSTVSSTVTLPDGAMVVVGGINLRNEEESVSRIPVLGELPLLEYLFSSREKTESVSTLFVFLRPVIMRQDRFNDLKHYTLADLEEARVAPEGTQGTDFFPTSDPMLLR